MKLYFGVVEDRLSDPLKLGRCKVRIVGAHTEDKVALPTEDLPWASLMGPTNSASNSGVGYSLTGILEGTWVIVVFRDEYNQFPVVIGTVPGIPTKDEVAVVENVIRSGDGTVWTDGSGQPITSGPVDSEKPKEEEPSNEFKKPTAMSLSENGIKELKKHEGLASLVPSPGRKIGSDATPSSTILYSYLDTSNIWTIGWGSTRTTTGVVSASTTMTKSEADALFIEKLKTEFEPSIKRNIKVPLTQSMYDACVSMVYNMGSSGFARSTVASLLNQGKYEAAAAQIPFTKNNGGVLSSRREAEKKLFLKDGIPQDDGTAKKIPVEETTTPDATQNPVVIKDERFSTTTTVVKQKSSPGFNDPTGVYPRYKNEPDTHRLARGERIDGTIVYKKEAARVKSVPTANGSNWTQPQIPYNAKYPYNNVYSTESGHVQEFDDTPGSERIHTYHKSGTYSEVDVNGTRVNRIVGDSFEILERNGNVLVKGNCNITVIGDANIRTENNATIEALGSIDIKAGGDVGIGSNGNIRLSASGEISLDGSAVHLNSGKGGSVKKSDGGANGGVSLSPLEVPSRHDVDDYAYETPEDGDGTEFNQKQIDTGKVDPEEIAAESATETTETKTMEEKPAVQKVEEGCDLIMTEKEFGLSYRLTETTTLKDMIGFGSSGVPTKTYGVSANEIVCNLKQLAINVIEPLKKKYPNLIITNSWRSETVNERNGSSNKSDHLYGCAADIQFEGFSRQQYYEAVQEIYKSLPTFQQLILEYKGSKTWIHVSYNLKKGNKRQAFTIDAAISSTKALPGGMFILKQ